METGVQRNDYDDEIDLVAVFRVLWAAWYWILLAGISIGLVAAAIVLSMPNVYRSEAILSPVSDAKSGNLAAIAGQLGGLASLAGLNLNGGSGVDKATTAIEILNSRIFLIDFIRRHDIAVPLIAGEAWDIENQKWIIDPEVYDINQKKWVREVPGSLKSEPSDLELYENFKEKISVWQDKKTQIIKLNVESLSPLYAQKWTQALVDDVNEYIKEKDVAEAERSIGYLNHELLNTSITEMQSLLYQMIEEQKKTVMLAAVREGYAFRIIDPPVIPEKKVGPKRILIVILSSFCAVFLSCMFVLVTKLMRSDSPHKK